MPHGDQGKTTLRGEGAGASEGPRGAGRQAPPQPPMRDWGQAASGASLRLQLQRRERRQGTWAQPPFPPPASLSGVWQDLRMQRLKASSAAPTLPHGAPPPGPLLGRLALQSQPRAAAPAWLQLWADSLLTGSEQDDLVVQWELREMGDPLGPLHQCEELLVCRLADVGNRVIGLPREETPPPSGVRGPATLPVPCRPPP